MLESLVNKTSLFLLFNSVDNSLKRIFFSLFNGSDFVGVIFLVSFRDLYFEMVFPSGL